MASAPELTLSGPWRVHIQQKLYSCHCYCLTVVAFNFRRSELASTSRGYSGTERDFKTEPVRGSIPIRDSVGH